MQYSQKRIIADVLSTHADEHIKNDIRALVHRKLDESLSSAIYGACTASDNEPKSLTLDDVREAMQPLKDKQKKLEEDAAQVVEDAFGIQASGADAFEFLSTTFYYPSALVSNRDSNGA